jgi:hypothetical protein
MKKEFITALLGGQEPSHFLVNFVFALIGVALTLLLSTTFRDIDSKRTPQAFCWKFFVRDNWKRVVSGLLLTLLALRFTQEIFGIEVTHFFAVVIGCIHDQLALIVKNKVKSFTQNTTQS